MIIITNDDGIYSIGIKTLYKAAVSVFGRSAVAVVAPSGPRSASGMSLTFHKPLRVEHVKTSSVTGYAVSGTPADCVYMARYELFKNRRIDLVLSGMNDGSNAGMEGIESSGTVSAVKFGAIVDIKGIAFSLETEKGGIDSATYENASKRISSLLSSVKRQGFPKNVDILNVNLPASVRSDTPMKACSIEYTMFQKFVAPRTDPSGRKYYWLWSTRKDSKRFAKGSDCYELFVNKMITITPVSMSVLDQAQLDEVEALVAANGGSLS